MKEYNNFIGIDIGKFSFFVAIYNNKDVREYPNDLVGISQFINDYKGFLQSGLTILETTGGYEMELLVSLCSKNFKVHRANTRKVKNFIRSYGNDAKTDLLDAKALALYGFERGDKLDIFIPQSERMLELYQLVQRRNDLKQMIIAEKNRLKAPRNNFIRNSCESIISSLTKQIELITQAINELIKSDKILNAKKGVLKEIPGIGELIANELIALLPELGAMNRKQIASLAGVAPKANDSGKFSGYRSVPKRGRNGIKPVLFIAAMAARNSNSYLKEFYQKMIANGKRKMVALTALMRKIIVIANAKVRDLNAELKHS
jgi:transposase